VQSGGKKGDKHSHYVLVKVVERWPCSPVKRPYENNRGGGTRGGKPKQREGLSRRKSFDSGGERVARRGGGKNCCCGVKFKRDQPEEKETRVAARTRRKNLVQAP